MKFLKALFILLGLTITTTSYGSSLEFDAVTKNGREMTLKIEGRKVTRDVESAILCGDDNSDVVLAKLWMPDHGHGSGPTELSETRDDCTLVDYIEFTMLGNWDIQIKFTDGDKGVFHVKVVR
jgi:hypothetical protein